MGQTLDKYCWIISKDINAKVWNFEASLALVLLRQYFYGDFDKINILF